ncbi:hypothetical protein OXYTRIMIC_591 [Oxytricha trifallax]|uniref:Uncharacterized protein n=1 Tax=Oxytricha trifallax TaxID=1172189 RepID=A0A073I147_9SPIT|nr:hypothetical protein OXYTRIMIC_591 [Oxytricha trifallax]
MVVYIIETNQIIVEFQLYSQQITQRQNWKAIKYSGYLQKTGLTCKDIIEYLSQRSAITNMILENQAWQSRKKKETNPQKKTSIIWKQVEMEMGAQQTILYIMSTDRKNGRGKPETNSAGGARIQEI